MGGLARKKQIILFARLKHSPAPRANMKLVPVIEHTCHQQPAASYTNTHSAEMVPCFYFPFCQHVECWCWWWWWFSAPLNGQAVSFWNWLKRGCWMHWWVSVTPAQVISIMLAPIPWTQAHGAADQIYHIWNTLSKYIEFCNMWTNSRNMGQQRRSSALE